MPTPPKPVGVLRMEGKSHRTKAELEQRERAEKAQMTGKRMKEAADVRADAVAHATWKRVAALLASIGKDDALYEQCINRYCRLASEVNAEQRELDRLEKMAQTLDEWDASGEIEKDEYLRRMAQLMEMKSGCQSLLMRKRKMMMDIEKENVMTVASSLRSIPKKATDEPMDDPMSRMLAERMRNRTSG